MALLLLVLVCCAFAALSRAQNWSDPGTILTTSAKPAITPDGKVYICSGNTLVVYNSDATVNWTAVLRAGNCARRITPIVDTAGQVYLATDRHVQIFTPQPETINSKKYTVKFLYNLTSGSNRLGSKGISGLAASTSSAAVMFYINTGYGGLYGVSIDGVPRWTIGGNTTTNVTSDWMKSNFPTDSFCLSNATGCFFHFTPAVDLCDGTIYIGHSNGMIYAIDGWQPFIRWRYFIGITGEKSEACVKVGNNGIVYAGIIFLQVVLAIDAQTGILIWKVPVGPMSFLTCYPRIDVTGYVYMGSADGYLYSISPTGDVVTKLMEDLAPTSVIQAPPFIECDGGELYVAHIEVRSKMISYTAMETVVSYSDAVGVTISQINAFTSAVLWRKSFSGNTTIAGGRTFDSTLMLALTAQDLAPGGACTNGENRLYATCVLNLTLEPLPAMSDKKFQAYYISLPVVFLGSLLAISVAYAYWSKSTRAARKKLRDARRKDMGVPRVKEKLEKRRTLLEKNLETTKAKFMENPESVSLQQELHAGLSELAFLEVLVTNQAHTNASQHGIRRKLEMSQGIPSWGSSPQPYYGNQGGFSSAAGSSPSQGGIRIDEPYHEAKTMGGSGGGTDAASYADDPNMGLMFEQQQQELQQYQQQEQQQYQQQEQQQYQQQEQQQYEQGQHQPYQQYT